ETALHLAAKQILSECREIQLPEVVVYERPRIVFPSESKYRLENVRTEQRTGGIVPDILADCGGRQLMIEIRVTHAVDEAKRKRIQELRISAIEIDLSRACRDLSPESLSNAVIEETANKKWLFNDRAAMWGDRYLRTTEKRGTIRRGFSLHVDHCPEKIRFFK